MKIEIEDDFNPQFAYFLISVMGSEQNSQIFEDNLFDPNEISLEQDVDQVEYENSALVFKFIFGMENYNHQVKQEVIMN